MASPLLLRSDFCCLQGENHENISGMDNNSAPPPADREGKRSGGGLFNIHSLHSVCVRGSRLPDVWHCGLGSVWAGVWTFTFAPWRFLLRRQKTHPQSSWARLSFTKSYLGWKECVQELQNIHHAKTRCLMHLRATARQFQFKSKLKRLRNQSKTQKHYII